MKKINAIVASKNQAKINAVKTVMKELEFDGLIDFAEVTSGVSEQPMSMAETREGAINRASSALTSNFDIAIGLEGGVYELGNEMFLCNWGALAANDGKIYTAAGAQLPLPEEIAVKLRAGMELGPVMDDFSKENGIRHHRGAVGVFTNGLVNRDEMFGHIVKLLVGQYSKHSD